MLPYRDSKLTKVALAIFFLIVIGYAYFEAQGLLFGPSIDISSDGTSAVDTPYVLIQGQAAHIASLAVDGNPIQVTQAGAFTEPYVLSPGLNRIVFDAVDKYGHTTEKVVEIVYTPSATATAPAISVSNASLAATSTVSAAEETSSLPATSSSGFPAIAPGR